MIIAAAFFILSYAAFILAARVFWHKIPEPKLSPNNNPQTKISVIIAVRNEAGNILSLLQDLENQRYPNHLFEVIVVDDFSEDNTVELVENFKANTHLMLSVERLPDHTATGKKNAIAFGINKSSGNLIVLTDGDCRVQPHWLAFMAAEYKHGSVKFISGPVSLSPALTFFEKLQVAEFSSLIGIGGAGIAMHRPTMCNGANVAYDKKAYLEVNGFSGNESLASGDDEFLMHKIHKAYPGQIRFLKAREAVVTTKPAPDFKGFIQQRVRWASKWRHYKNITSQLVAVIVFGANLSLLWCLAAQLFSAEQSSYCFALICLKVAMDLLFLTAVLTFLGRLKYLVLFLPLQLVYVPYVLYCALAGLSGNYQWKARSIRT